MGHYSSSDDESSRKHKKKKRRRSRSRSYDSGDSKYSTSRHHKKVKKKHKRRSRTRSPTEDRHSRQDRSPGRRHRSPSWDKGQRSRSSDRRRSRSYDRNRSRSRNQRSRSGSYDWHHGRHGSRSRDRSRKSFSRSKSKSPYHRSPDKRKSQSSGTSSRTSPSKSESTTTEIVPGFNGMTPAEQAQVRLKMALKAAALADERLKGDVSIASLSLDKHNFADAVAEIESDSFVPAAFKASRSSKASHKDVSRDGIDSSSHDLAMFGTVGSSVVFTKTEPIDRSMLDNDPEAIVDASQRIDPDEKMKRWIQKLTALRRKKVDGNAFEQ